MRFSRNVKLRESEKSVGTSYDGAFRPVGVVKTQALAEIRSLFNGDWNRGSESLACLLILSSRALAVYADHETPLSRLIRPTQPRQA